jgi:outer membrane protein assembly factor BamB
MIRKIAFFTIALTLLLTLGTMAQMTYGLYPTTDPWLMWRHDLARSGVGTGTAPNNNQTIWTWAHAGMTTTPLVLNGTVIVADYSKFYALDETTGIQLWNTTFTIQGSISGNPTYSDGSIFFGTTSGYLYSMSATNGAKVWEYNAGDQIYTSPSVSNGIVYFGTTGGYLYALDLATGGYLWYYSTSGGAIRSSPTIHQNWLYFGCDDGKIYALNITGTTPALKWRFSTNNTIRSTPAYGNGMIFIGTSSTDHSLIALNATATSPLGQMIWKYKLTQGYAIDNSPAFARIGSNDLVFFTGAYDQAYALYANALPGTYSETDPAIRKWQETVGYNPTSPVVVDGKVFFGVGNLNLYALNATTGNTKWTYEFSNYAPDEPIVADGHVFVTNYAGLTCFGISYPPQTYYYTVNVLSQNFVIKLVIANATPGSQMDISVLLTQKKLGYTLQGIENTIGMSNITIPNALLGGTYTVTVDGASPFTGPTVVNNGTHSSIYFTYLQSSHSVIITGTTVIPEFSPALMLPLLMAMSAAAVILARKKLRSK